MLNRYHLVQNGQTQSITSPLGHLSGEEVSRAKLREFGFSSYEEWSLEPTSYLEDQPTTPVVEFWDNTVGFEVPPSPGSRFGLNIHYIVVVSHSLDHLHYFFFTDFPDLLAYYGTFDSYFTTLKRHWQQV